MSSGDGWRMSKSQRQQVGRFILDYLRGRGAEGGHQVSFPDGRRLRVLPDGRSTGKYRSHRIVSDLTALDVVWESFSDAGLDPVLWLVGSWAVAGFDWQLLLPETRSDPEAVIGEVLRDFGSTTTPAKLLAELEAAGWSVRPVEETVS